MKKIIFLPLLLVFLVGCASSPATSPSLPTPTPAAASGATAQSQNPSALTLERGTFTLTIFSPIDQSVVSTPSVELKGEVSAEAVLTINNDIYVLPPGAFTETVPLVAGSNAIEIVASDMSGSQVDLILTVTYQP